MSELKEPTPAFLTCSFLYHIDHFAQADLEKLWSERFGDGDVFEVIHFPMKSYYSKEMGDESRLKRFVYCSHTLVERTKMISSKVWATEIELSTSVDNKRTVNIDPGLLTLENFQLSTGKPYAHRIYLGQGVYSDLTYLYQAKKMNDLPWTYPDYKEESLKSFFIRERLLLMDKINNQY